MRTEAQGTSVARRSVADAPTAASLAQSRPRISRGGGPRSASSFGTSDLRREPRAAAPSGVARQERRERRWPRAAPDGSLDDGDFFGRRSDLSPTKRKTAWPSFDASILTDEERSANRNELKSQLDFLRQQVTDISTRNEKLFEDYGTLKSAARLSPARAPLYDRIERGSSSQSAALPLRGALSGKKESGLKSSQLVLMHLEEQKRSLQDELQEMRGELEKHITLRPLHEQKMKKLEADVKRLADELDKRTRDLEVAKKENFELQMRSKEKNLDSSKDVREKERELRLKGQQLERTQLSLAELEDRCRERDSQIEQLARRLQKSEKGRRARDASIVAALRSSVDALKTHSERQQHLGLEESAWESLSSDVSAILAAFQTKLTELIQAVDECAARVEVEEESAVTREESPTGRKSGRESQSPDKEVAALTRLRNVDHELDEKRRQLEDLETKVSEKTEEMSSFATHKELVSALQDKLQERERELEERDRLFEDAMKQQQQEFEEKRGELKMINEQIGQMVEKQRLVELREGELRARAEELDARESSQADKEKENAAILQHLMEVMEEQQTRDLQAQEELQRGYSALQAKHAEVSQREEALESLKKEMEEQAMRQQAMVEKLNAHKQEIMQQKMKWDHVRTRLESDFQMKRRESAVLDSSLAKKKKGLEQLQAKESAAQNLIAKLEERERVFSERERRFQELSKQRTRELQSLEQQFVSNRDRLAKLQTFLAEKLKEKESLEKAEMNNRISEFKMEEKLQRKRHELEELDSVVRKRKQEIMWAQSAGSLKGGRPSAEAADSDVSVFGPADDPAMLFNRSHELPTPRETVGGSSSGGGLDDFALPEERGDAGGHSWSDFDLDSAPKGSL